MLVVGEFEISDPVTLSISTLVCFSKTFNSMPDPTCHHASFENQHACNEVAFPSPTTYSHRLRWNLNLQPITVVMDSACNTASLISVRG